MLIVNYFGLLSCLGVHLDCIVLLCSLRPQISFSWNIKVRDSCLGIVSWTVCVAYPNVMENKKLKT